MTFSHWQSVWLACAIIRQRDKSFWTRDHPQAQRLTKWSGILCQMAGCTLSDCTLVLEAFMHIIDKQLLIHYHPLLQEFELKHMPHVWNCSMRALQHAFDVHTNVVMLLDESIELLKEGSMLRFCWFGCAGPFVWELPKRVENGWRQACLPHLHCFGKTVALCGNGPPLLTIVQLWSTMAYLRSMSCFWHFWDFYSRAWCLGGLLARA